MARPTKTVSSGDDRVPGQSSEDRAQEILKLQNLTMEERGELIAIACRTAAKVERSRRENGMPPSTSVPWPASTWEFLKKSAKDV